MNPMEGQLDALELLLQQWMWLKSWELSQLRDGHEQRSLVVARRVKVWAYLERQ